MTMAISVTELKKRLARKENIELVDVRRKTDYQASPEKINQAQWRNPDKVDEWRSELPTDRSLVLYCAEGGSVSQSVAEKLGKTRGQVFYLEGGIKAWRESESPVE